MSQTNHIGSARLSDSAAWDLMARARAGEELHPTAVLAFIDWAERRDEAARAYEMKECA